MIEQLRHSLHRRRQPGRYAQLAQLLRNQALSREQVLRGQADALAAMVAHAADQVPYYAARFDTAARAAFARGEAAIERLPILRKADVRAHLDALLARDAERAQARIGHTGGSTGQPLAFWYDDAKHELMRAGMMRGYMMSGWRPGQKILNFWGARQDVAAGGVFGAGLFDFIAAEKTIAAWQYSEADLHAWANFIRRYRPTLLQGYASALDEIARYVLHQRLRMPDSLIGIYSTAEMLDDNQRARMQQAFGCKVYNQYGSREVPNIAWECRHGRMHVCADLVWLESSAIDGEERLLVTSLTNRQMPFIRYDIGDSGRLLDDECPCGSPFPLMEMGLCRRNDLIRTRDGKRIHPAYFNRLLYGRTEIRQYQWLQRDLDRLELDIVAADALPPATVAELARRIREDIDPAMTLHVNTVADIPRTLSGKHRYVIGIG